jgi:hypothetical protein
MTPRLLTTQQVSERLGISPGRVRQLADLRGLGWKPNARVRLFSEDDVEAMRVRIVGRPRTTTSSRETE